MFDIIGFWAAATMFCVPPFIFLLWTGLCIANHQVKVESQGEMSIPLYTKIYNKFSKDMVSMIAFCSLIPAIFLVIAYICEVNIKGRDYSIIQWVAHYSEVWSGFFGWIFFILMTFVVTQFLAKFYAKFVILSERVKKL